MSRVLKLLSVVLASALLALLAGCGGAEADSATANRSASTVEGADEIVEASTTTSGLVDAPTTIAEPEDAPTTTAAPTATSTSTTTSTTEAQRTTETGFGGGEPLLLAAVERTQVETIRMEMFMEMVMQMDGESIVFGSTNPLMSGTQSGDAFEMHMDMGAIFGEDLMLEMGMDEQLLAMDMVGNSEVAYMRSPLFADPAIAADLGTVGLPDLGDGWLEIRYDELLEAFPELGPEEILSSVSGQSMNSLDQWFDIATFADLVGDGAPSTVRGVATTRYSGTVSFDELLDAQGLDDIAGLESFAGDPMLEETLESLGGLEIGLTFDIDSDGYLRSMAMDMDMAPFLVEMAEEFGEEIPSDLVFEISMLVELFDFSSEPADITFPEPSEITGDLTEWMVSALELVG